MSILLLAAATAATLPLESATLPLPPELRAGASIVSVDEEGHVATLREGTGKMVCIADRPGDDRFDARCYHRDFIPYLYRARQLSAQGLKRDEIDARIEQELADGSFSMTMKPSAGYRMLGPISALTGEGTGWTDEMRRWQSLHIPRATAGDLGFVTEREGSMPFVMASGRLWAHVMINTPER